jgi:hypothetical protein
MPIETRFVLRLRERVFGVKLQHHDHRGMISATGTSSRLPLLVGCCLRGGVKSAKVTCSVPVARDGATADTGFAWLTTFADSLTTSTWVSGMMRAPGSSGRATGNDGRVAILQVRQPSGTVGEVGRR